MGIGFSRAAAAVGRQADKALGVGSALLLLSAFAPLAHANGVAFNKGDVMASVASGAVQHRTPGGVLLDTLSDGHGGFTTGQCYDPSGNLLVTNFSNGSIAKYDTGGNLVTANFVTGFPVNESCSFINNTNFFTGQPSSASIHEFTVAGAHVTDFATNATGDGNGGTDWVDVAADQHTIHFTDEGQFIHVFDTATSTELANLNSAALPGGACYAHRILSDQSELVACSGLINHVGATGNLILSSPVAGNGGGLFALNLDPDGTTFWTGDFATGNVFHLNISDLSLINTWNTGTGGDTLFGLSVVGEQTVGCTTCTTTGGGGATPELDSVVLFGSGATGLLGYAMMRIRAARKRDEVSEN